MRVVATNLAMRFYKNDGWTSHQLYSIVKYIGPECLEDPYRYFDDTEPYWIPNVGTRLDIDSLMLLVTEVVRVFNDHPELTDRQILESKNW